MGVCACVLVAGAWAPAWAQLATRPAADWARTLDAPDRLAGLKVDEVVARLELKPGDVVADLGAGTGPFEVAMAKAVSPRGKVYAVDIDRGFFDYIAEKTRAAGVSNVQTVLGEFTDPKLPARDVDVAVFHDVLHHIEDRPTYLKNLAGYLKPTARIAVIDYEGALGPHRAEPTLQVTQQQTAAWLAAFGYRPVKQIELFTDKWFVVYAKP